MLKLDIFVVYTTYSPLTPTITTHFPPYLSCISSRHNYFVIKLSRLCHVSCRTMDERNYVQAKIMININNTDNNHIPFQGFYYGLININNKIIFCLDSIELGTNDSSMLFLMLSGQLSYAYAPATCSREMVLLFRKLSHQTLSFLLMECVAH